MKARIRPALFALALAIACAAPAAALFPCVDCEPSTDPNARCAGICNGHHIRTCSEWFFYGCGGQFAQSRMTEEAASVSEDGSVSEEQFLRSLREQVPAPAGLE